MRRGNDWHCSVFFCDNATIINSFKFWNFPLLTLPCCGKWSINLKSNTVNFSGVSFLEWTYMKTHYTFCWNKTRVGFQRGWCRRVCSHVVTAAMLEEWNTFWGIKLSFYANPSFCFIMQIRLLVTWANTLCNQQFSSLILSHRLAVNKN